MGYNPGYVDGKLVANNAAYTPGLGLWKVLDTVEGTPAYWVYVTTDSLSAVQAAGYITDATFKRLKVGDIVDVFSGTLLSETANPPVGNTLGAATFAATLGVLSQFNGAPLYQRMQVSAVTAPTTTVSGAATLIAVEPNSSSLGNLPRNLIDGGDFTTNPWQLATSFNGSGATAQITADRWIAIAGTSLTWVASQQSNLNVPGFSAAYQWGRSVGDTHTTGLTFGQVLETIDVIRLQGLPVALSFWNGAGGNFAAGASAGTYLVQIIGGTGVNETFLKMISASSWSGYTVLASAAYTPGVSTYTRVSPLGAVVPTGVTELGVAVSYQPTTAATSPGITAGANEWLQFLGVQLEVGAMTAFEHLDVAEVVNICTRYLQVIKEPTAGICVGPASFSASSLATVHIPLASPLRQAPTVTFTAGGFAIIDALAAAHTVSAAGLVGATTGAVTLNVTAAATFSAANANPPVFMQGRTTNSGIIILDSDYA
jgi:hypothetical protein